jgi:hypothetical protein
MNFKQLVLSWWNDKFNWRQCTSVVRQPIDKQLWRTCELSVPMSGTSTSWVSRHHPWRTICKTPEFRASCKLNSSASRDVDKQIHSLIERIKRCCFLSHEQVNLSYHGKSEFSQNSARLEIQHEDTVTPWWLPVYNLSGFVRSLQPRPKCHEKGVGCSFQLELSMVKRCGVAHWMRDALTMVSKSRSQSAAAGALQIAILTDLQRPNSMFHVVGM